MEPHVHEIQGLEPYFEKYGLAPGRPSAFKLAYRFFEDVYRSIK
jgi:hypothetical protein